MRLVRGRFKPRHGRIGKPFNRAKPSLRKSQRRSKRQARFHYNRYMRVRLGIRCMDKAKPFIYEAIYGWLKSSMESAAKEMMVEIPGVEQSPDFWPHWLERVSAKLGVSR